LILSIADRWGQLWQKRIIMYQYAFGFRIIQIIRYLI
jgi:hypothetical protein